MILASSVQRILTLISPSVKRTRTVHSTHMLRVVEVTIATKYAQQLTIYWYSNSM